MESINTIIDLGCQSHWIDVSLFDDAGDPVTADYTGYYFFEVENFNGTGMLREFKFPFLENEHIVFRNVFPENGVTIFKLKDENGDILTFEEFVDVSAPDYDPAYVPIVFDRFKVENLPRVR